MNESEEELASAFSANEHGLKSVQKYVFYLNADSNLGENILSN